MKEIDDHVCGFVSHFLVLSISLKTLGHSLSKATLKEVPENRHLFETLTDGQSHRSIFHINIIQGLSFATRGNIMQKTDQVIDELSVDHIREALECTPNLHKRNFPNADLPSTFVPSILARYDLANLCGINDVLHPWVCLCVRLSCWINCIV